ncbi:NaeI family type II restriction endonuclease [Streptomyces althioticus]|uniref:NaeI family type II restriction endonuclease n=1 Tax=Streptomyces althioticus TaxID=83380 RepID=UPI0036CAEDC7
MDALVLLLLDIRRQTRLSVEDVHELLKISGRLEGQLPGRSTLYRKLGGAGLRNERRLVEAVIEVCVSDERRADALKKQAISLLQQAWSKDAESVPPPVAARGEGGLMSELVNLQRKLIDTQARLTAALQTVAEAEKESARARALVTTLLMLGAFGHPMATGTSASTPSSPSKGSLEIELSELRVRLAATEAERDEARRAARAAPHRPITNEGAPADRGQTSADPTDLAGPSPSAAAGPLEWPSTRTDPAGPDALADIFHGSGTAGSDTHASPVRQGPVSVLETQMRERVRPPQQDAELAAVYAEMLRLDPDGSRMASVIDGAGRHVLDPVHTGRYLWSQLTKAERMAFSMTVHQRMQRELGLADGLSLDFTVAGHEVDMRFSQGNDWMFPPELQGGLCLVVQADDVRGRWSLGLLRVESDLMRAGSNRDGKRRLSVQGRKAIQWIHRDLPLPEHALRRLPSDSVEAIFAHSSAQARTEELFLRAQLTAITTADLSAVTMQNDGVKRVREARRRLARRGVLVVGGASSHGAEQITGLGLSALKPRTWMSVRLAPASTQDDGSPTISLDGTSWRAAHPDDPETPLPASALTRPARQAANTLLTQEPAKNSP